MTENKTTLESSVGLLFDFLESNSSQEIQSWPHIQKFKNNLSPLETVKKLIRKHFYSYLETAQRINLSKEAFENLVENEFYSVKQPNWKGYIKKELESFAL